MTTELQRVQRRVQDARVQRLEGKPRKASGVYCHRPKVAGRVRLQQGRKGEATVRENSAKAMMILIAGPYRSGTGDDPELIRKNLELMESYALPIFRAGHIPVLGEWFALPLVALAGSRQIGDETFNEIFHPIAVRLEEKCDAVLRVGGASEGADQMVRVGESLGLKIYRRLEEIPGVE